MARKKKNSTAPYSQASAPANAPGPAPAPVAGPSPVPPAQASAVPARVIQQPHGAPLARSLTQGSSLALSLSAISMDQPSSNKRAASPTPLSPNPVFPSLSSAVPAPNASPPVNFGPTIASAPATTSTTDATVSPNLFFGISGANRTFKKSKVSKADAADTSDAEPAGRQRGKNYSRKEIDLLLDTTERFLPTGSDAWEPVAIQYNHEAKKQGYPERDAVSLGRKFKSLANYPKPTGNPECPDYAQRAKRIYKRLKGEIAAGSIGLPSADFDEADLEVIEDGDDECGDGIAAGPSPPSQTSSPSAASSASSPSSSSSSPAPFSTKCTPFPSTPTEFRVRGQGQEPEKKATRVGTKSHVLEQLAQSDKEAREFQALLLEAIRSSSVPTPPADIAQTRSEVLRLSSAMDEQSKALASLVQEQARQASQQSEIVALLHKLVADRSDRT